MKQVIEDTYGRKLKCIDASLHQMQEDAIF